MIKSLKDCASFEPEERRGNIFSRPFTLLSKGGVDRVQGHSHNFHHVTYVHQGEGKIVLTYPDGLVEEKNISAGQSWLTNKDVNHEIITTVPTREEVLADLEQATPEEIKERLVEILTLPLKGVCIFSLRDPEGHVVEEIAEGDAAKMAMLNGTT